MQGHATTNRINMLICEQRCSEEFRQLAAKHGWGLLEGIGSDHAVHACVAIEPVRVCVELVNAPRLMPDIVRRLATLDSVGRVGCLAPRLLRGLESSIVELGAIALGSIAEAEDWLCASEAGGGISPVDNQNRSSRLQVHRRASHPERSVFL